MTKGTSGKPTSFFDFGRPGQTNWWDWLSGRPAAPSAGQNPVGPGPSATLTVTFNSEDAAASNAMGWYNARTGQAGILFADLNDDGRNAAVHAGDTRSLTVLQSDLDAGKIGFFMIPNGASQHSKSALSSPMRFEVGPNGVGRIVIDRNFGGDVVLNGTRGDVLFSNQDYNKGGYDYVSGQVGTNGQTKAQKFGAQSDGSDGILGTMAWDDQAVQPNNCGPDRDFNDVVFTVTKQGSSNQPPSNSAPTDINLSNASINENLAGGVVGTLSTVDPNAGNTHTYTVNDNRFEVAGGQLKLKAGTSLDYEAGSSVQLKITTTDQGGLAYSENFTIAVNNVNEAPVDIALSNLTVSENASGAVVGMLSTTDPDAGNTHTYSVNDNRFEVAGGQLKLKAGTSLDYETQSSIQLKVTTTDQGGLSYSENFTIAVKDVNEAPSNSAPTDISLSNASVNENVLGGAIGTLSTVDPNAGNTHTYTVNDNRFEVVGTQLKLKSTSSLNFEAGSSVQLKITTTDQGGLSYSENFTIAVNDVNEAPVDIALSKLTVDENASGGAVGMLSTTDPDAGNTHAYTVSDNRFEVVGGQLKLKTGTSLDYEAGSSVQLKVTTTDQGGLSYSKNFTIAVNDVNETPGTIVDKDGSVNTVLETAAVGTVVGITASAVDPDAGDSITYSLSNNAGGLFAVDSKTGVVTVAGGLDYETANQHTITVRATDGGGKFSEANFDIKVGDVTQHTVDGYLAGATVFADANGNGTRDAGEAYVITDAFGAFELKANGAPLVMVGGYDIATGLAFQGKLTAQAGSTVITPLTTLMAEFGKAGVPNPTATLASALGLMGVSDFGQLDPIAAATNSIAAFARSSQVLNTVTMVANLITGANPGLGMEQATAAAFAVLASQAADGVLNLNDGATLAQLINGTAGNLGVPALDSQLVADVATVVAASNGAIDDIVTAGGSTDTLLAHITAASIVAQDETSITLKLSGATGDSSELVAGYTDGELTSLIDFAVNHVGNLHGTGTAGTNGNDVINGTAGADIILGGAGKDTLSGGDGNDQLYGDTDDDVLNGGNDEDRLIGGTGNNMLNGGLGADTYIHSGTAADGNDTVMTGDNGVDRVVFGTADLQDLNYQRVGNDLVVGAHHTGGPDFDGSIKVVNHYAGSSIAFVEIDTTHNLDFGANPDVSRFFFTTDLTDGLNNDDAAEVLLGGNAGEIINGNGGYYDAIFGGGGNDVITGGTGGVDNLHGGTGDDQIFADGGDDILSGDAGNDTLDGGAGSDTFLFDLGSSGADTLVAFDKSSDVLSFTGVADKNANGVDLTDLLSLVSAIHDFGLGSDVVVDFSTGASLTFQGAGTAGNMTSSLTALVANPVTQIHVA